MLICTKFGSRQSRVQSLGKAEGFNNLNGALTDNLPSEIYRKRHQEQKY